MRQLIDSLNEDLVRDEVEDRAFGILIGNPQRLLDPINRNLDFTEKCKRSAKREQIALVKTVDLFKVAKYLLEHSNEGFKIECRAAIKGQLGEIVKFPDLPTR